MSAGVVLVTGATGTVGREIVRELRERGVPVRAMSRDPEAAQRKAHADPGVEWVRGDLTDVDSVRAALDGVDAAHLIGFAGDFGAPLENGADIAAAVRDSDVARVTVLINGMSGTLEDGLDAEGVKFTHLQPVEFMANAITDWSESIRTTDSVHEPYVERLSAMVHESDIGAVAAVALTSDGHLGQAYVITGPEALTVADKVGTIADALGRHIELVAIPDDQAVDHWRSAGADDETIEFYTWIYATNPEVGYAITDTVPRLTGRPARTFAQWVRAHTGSFS